MVDDITDTGDLPRYISDRLFDELTVESSLNVDDWNNGDVFQIVTPKSKFPK